MNKLPDRLQKFILAVASPQRQAVPEASGRGSPISPEQNWFLWLALVAVALLLALADARADWPNTNATKFVQFPNVTDTGMDVYFGEYPLILADDFVCTNTGPITDLHLWISSLANAPATGARIQLSIWEDVPASPGSPSHPGKRLWFEVFDPGQYQVVLAATGLKEEFWKLEPPAQLLGTDTNLFLYNFFPKLPYYQTGSLTAPVVYWLGASFVNNQPPQGWKTSTNHLAPDFAVLGHYNAANDVTDWMTLFDPRNPTLGLDFAFALTTLQPSNPPPTCVETNGVKYTQAPKIDGGYDVWDNGPWVLADDFICTTTGPITDIHIWGSWLEDKVETNLSFWIGIYDDVPAVTNGTVFIPSRPGTNLLWQQWFAPGEYAQQPWGIGIESFLDPGPPAVMGPDSQAQYYCFYPKEPFLQTGDPNKPKIYWLSVYARSPATGGQPFGWKTTFNRRFDTSVHAQWPGAPPITTAWEPTFDPNRVPLDLAFKITTSTNQPPQVCTENDVKYVQYPNRDGGLDVWDNGPWVLADDFICTNTGPVTDIHLWGSWLYDRPATNLTFWIGIYDDVPATPNTPSHPGGLKWQQWFGPGQYVRTRDGSGIEQFLDPGPPAIMGPDSEVWYYCFYPTNAFIQEGTAAAPKIYWLVVHSDSPAGANELFGWKSTTGRRFDISVHGDWPGGPPPAGFPWMPTHDATGREVDLAFKITTLTNVPPDVCTENEVKYVQFPNRDGGLDVWNNGPWVLGDDFICTNRGPVTDIHLWGSWLNDKSSTNLAFWIGIYDDVPATPTSPSHPGGLKWEQWFGPGQYVRTPDGTGFEQFLDPGPPAILGPDSEVWYYCFYPTNAFFQEGTATDPRIYWLVVHSDAPAGTAGEPFGWKTTAQRRFDISVHGPWPGGPPPAAFPWEPTKDVFGRELDLAFKVTTRTNPCPFRVECPPNKVVDCTAAWAFDLPKVYSPCCGTNYTITVASTVTNGVCPQMISRTWIITDCLTNVATCVQTVALVSTTPTVVICATNKVVECGTTWAPDPPIVLPSPCCGTNYSVIQQGAITNGGFCNQVIAFTWVVIDCCNKTNVCRQLVTVVDTTPPVVTCPTNKVVECGTAWAFDPPQAVDACCGTNVTRAILGTVTNGTCPTEVTRSWVIEDCCTNRAVCTQTVRIVDTTPPTLVCPSNMVVKTCGTNAIVTWTETASDLCGGVVVSSSPASGTSFLPNTTNVVTISAKDDCGNTSSCTFLVAVVRPALGTLSISLSGTTLTLGWTDGILQEASAVIGPWTDVAGATPPAYSTPLAGTMKFYRLRCNSP